MPEVRARGRCDRCLSVPIGFFLRDSDDDAAADVIDDVTDALDTPQQRAAAGFLPATLSLRHDLESVSYPPITAGAMPSARNDVGGGGGAARRRSQNDPAATPRPAPPPPSYTKGRETTKSLEAPTARPGFGGVESPGSRTSTVG